MGGHSAHHAGRMREGEMNIGLAMLLGAGLALLTGCVGGRSMGRYEVQRGAGAIRGEQVIAEKSCGSCHTIPGVRGARGLVGPPLFFFSRRTMIAGELPNTPDNLVRWIRSPESVEPATAMPNLGLTETEARDVVSYLYTLR